jgi:hypothetical protein
MWDSKIYSVMYYVMKTLTPNYKGATRKKDIACVTCPLTFVNIWIKYLGIRFSPPPIEWMKCQPLLGINLLSDKHI